MPLHQDQFRLDIFDHSSIAYCVVELVLDDNGKPTDWIYRYCNQAFADKKGYRLEAMVDHPISSLFPTVNEKMLQAYYLAAYENKPCEMDIQEEKKYHVAIMPVGKRGFCSGMLYVVSGDEKQNPQENDSMTDVSYILQKLFPEYVSLYRIELNSGKYEILRLADNTNAKYLTETKEYPFATYDVYAKQYAAAFIPEGEREEFLDWHTCRNMKKRLRNTDKITYYYHSVSRQGKDRYYEAYAVKGKTDGENFNIFLGYRNVDSILYKERATQEKLKKALAEAKLGNEIVSAIAKTYQYVSRIDIQADWFEEISNRDKENLKFINSGVLSVNNKKVCRDLVAEEYQEAFFEFTDIFTLPERMKTKETIAMEYRMKDGNWHKLRFIEKKRDPDGKLTHVLCAIRSISDDKKREQTLLYQVAEAQKEATFKTRFLSNMSHDIRTPMNGIIGMVELADRYPDDMEMQKKCRSKVMEMSKYLVSLLGDILAVNKLESGDFIDEELPFDLAELLNRSNTDRQIQAQEKNVEYEVDWGKADLKYRYLVGNPVYLEKLLNAVSDNAVKFTNPGGTVHVWCAEKSSDEKQVVYEFGCADNGIGMSEEFRDHAFDLFSQENQTSRTKYEGAGLGLAIAKRISEKLGGTIELKSQKGIGTTVIMTIPFKLGDPEEAEPATAESLGEISLKGLRALIVEDNELNMEIARFMLEDNGIRVEGAKDGLEAVKKFKETSPGYYDVILMDVMMPNMNGWDATRKIRSMKKTDSETIPIIAMSANAFAEDIINSRISGMNEHLTKPLDEKKLLDEIRKCLGRKNDNTRGTVNTDQKL